MPSNGEERSGPATQTPLASDDRCTMQADDLRDTLRKLLGSGSRTGTRLPEACSRRASELGLTPLVSLGLAEKVAWLVRACECAESAGYVEATDDLAHVLVFFSWPSSKGRRQALRDAVLDRWVSEVPPVPTRRVWEVAMELASALREWRCPPPSNKKARRAARAVGRGFDYEDLGVPRLGTTGSLAGRMRKSKW